MKFKDVGFSGYRYTLLETMGVQKIIDENELLARLRVGDEVAFGEIYDLYGREFAYKLRKLVKITVVVEERRFNWRMQLSRV